MTKSTSINYQDLSKKIKQWAIDLGFEHVGISDVDLSKQEPRLLDWLDKHYHGEMQYMAQHGLMRARPAELLPGTMRVISVALHYLPTSAKFAQTLANPKLAYVSRYALGRDYHKLMRNKLKQLGDKIKSDCQQLNCRPFVDSAPVLERPLAEKAGLGWVGKHSLLINEKTGSWFFLGELLVDIELPIDQPQQDQCGHCVACINICPTNAIVAPYVVDARRCISYLTIEYDGIIDPIFRQAMGNRIYGCDDCQLVCPWNKDSQLTQQDDFSARHSLDHADLLTLFSWDEATFLQNTAGSPIRRIGHRRWIRNLSIAMGNAPFDQAILKALQQFDCQDDPVLIDHIGWAIEQQQQKQYRQSRLTSRLIRTIEKGLPRDA